LRGDLIQRGQNLRGEESARDRINHITDHVWHSQLRKRGNNEEDIG